METASANQAGYNRYLELKKLLKGEPNDDEMSALWNLEKGIKKNMIRFVVVDIGNSIINLIVLVNLLSTIL